MHSFLTGRARVHLLFISVLVLTSILYSPGLTGGYVFDDLPNLLDNKRLAAETLDLESIKRAAFSSGAGPLRRPVSMTSFALNRYFFGVEPYSYKAVNLSIHLLTGIMLYLFSRLLILSYHQRSDIKLSDTAANWVPLVVSSIWLIHPLNLTSVLYIVQRMTSLSTLFMASGLYLYMLGRRRLYDGKPGASIMLIGLLVFGSLATLSKEIGALLPIYMLVIESSIFRFRDRSGRSDKFISWFFVFSVLLPVCLLLIWLTFYPSFISGAYAGRDFTLSERLFTEARALMLYLKMIITPSVSTLGLQHDDISISTGLFAPRSTFYSVLTLLGLAATAFLTHRKSPLVSLGIFWFFTGHLMESTIWPLEIAHEHRNYLADFGIILALTITVTHLATHYPSRIITFGLPILYLCMLSYTTRIRAEQWSNSVDHAIFEAIHHPKSYRAAISAGNIYAQLALNGESELAKDAFKYWQRAHELNQGNISHLAAQIKLSYRLDLPVNSWWFDELEHRLEHGIFTFGHRDAISALVECARDYCRISNAQMQRIFNAILENQRLESRSQMHAEAISLHAFYMINNLNDFDQGLGLFRKAVDIRPDELQYRINLIKVLAHMHKFDAAEKELHEYEKLNVINNNAIDQQMLRTLIDSKRKQSTSSSTTDDRLND